MAPANSTTLTPPIPPLKWAHTAEEIVTETKAAIEKMRVARDEVAALPKSEATFDSVFVRLAEIEADALIISRLTYYGSVAPEAARREAGDKAEQLLDEFKIESSMRMDLYDVKLTAAKNIQASGQKLDAEEQLLVDRMILEGKRSGLGLSDAAREELKRMKLELSQLTQEYMRNVGEDKDVVSFTREELHGVSEDVISGYAKRTVDGKEFYDVTLKLPDINPVTRDASNPETRRRAAEAAANLAMNVVVFEKTLGLRRKMAKLLGYASWADYVIEENVAKTASRAHDFLQDLEQKLRPLAQKEKLAVLVLKQEDCTARNLPFDRELNVYDWGYYDKLYKERALNLDTQLVKEYFPVEEVVPRLLDIYQELLSLRFEPCSGDVWAPEVKMYAVWERNAKDERGFCGYFYLDLYPRDGKNSGASMCPLSPGFSTVAGRHYPIAAVQASLAKPNAQRPGLMSHMDTTLLFHEMGHIYHELLSRTRFARFHGTISPVDFAEAPSQMLENWCWDSRILSKVTSHYETKQPMPADLCESIVKSRRVNIAMFYLFQVFMAKFDLMVHTDEDTSGTLEKYWKQRQEMLFLKYDLNPKGFGPTNITHMMHGYDAAVYSYLYSNVFAHDMWATVFQADPLNPELGQQYRRSVLQPGASRDEMITLEEFIGRPPRSDAFLRVLLGESGVVLRRQ